MEKMPKLCIDFVSEIFKYEGYFYESSMTFDWMHVIGMTMVGREYDDIRFELFAVLGCGWICVFLQNL
uniref:Uncharacterized protein n=1 Tax=Picea sitchensis TaxID=3332 RepID=D5AC45_PICSI|nr:unknown [Picea sitchensis]